MRARHEAYAKRDAAGRRAEAIEGRLQHAQARRDRRAAERLKVDLDEALAEINYWARFAAEIEAEMDVAAEAYRRSSEIEQAAATARKRWWRR